MILTTFNSVYVTSYKWKKKSMLLLIDWSVSSTGFPDVEIKKKKCALSLLAASCSFFKSEGTLQIILIRATYAM